MLRQKLLINIWLLHLVGFFSLLTLNSRCTVTGTWSWITAKCLAVTPVRGLK
jgi:hypothetical protein